MSNFQKYAIIVIIIIIICIASKYIIVYANKLLSKFFKIEKKKYNELLFNSKISKLKNENIEKALNIAIQERKNEIDEYYKILMFFWGIQLAFIVAAIQLLLDIVNIENTNLYSKTRELKIILLTSVSFLIYILIVIQTISLLKKDGKINSYSYHIAYLEYYLNMNIHSVLIVQDRKDINNCKNYKKGIYYTLGFISVFWELVCSFGFLLYYKINIMDIFKIQHKFHFIFLYILVFIELFRNIFIIIATQIINNKSINIDNDIFAIQLNTFIKSNPHKKTNLIKRLFYYIQNKFFNHSKP